MSAGRSHGWWSAGPRQTVLSANRQRAENDEVLATDPPDDGAIASVSEVIESDAVNCLLLEVFFHPLRDLYSFRTQFVARQQILLPDEVSDSSARHQLFELVGGG